MVEGSGCFSIARGFYLGCNFGGESVMPPGVHASKGVWDHAPRENFVFNPCDIAI